MTNEWFRTDDKCAAFLGFKYIPESSWDFDEGLIESVSNQPAFEGDSDLLIKNGSKALSEAFDSTLDLVPNETTHIVPLSGGLDSRTILAELLEKADREKIVTLTFGTPGTLDYDIGTMVAEKVGVENLAIDLSPGGFDWTEDRLIDTARSYSRPTKLFRSVSAFRYALDTLDVDDYTLWTGYLGDPSAGEMLPETESQTWNEAVDLFLRKNYSFKSLTPDGFDPYDHIPESPAFDKSVLSYDEQLNYGVRQPNFIRPATLITDSAVTPFKRSEWLSFAFSVPRELRKHRKLFENLVMEKHTDIFELPTETYAGYPINSHPFLPEIKRAYWKAKGRILRETGFPWPYPYTNHIDWNVELQKETHFKSLVMKQLSDLGERDRVSWLDTSQLWENQERKRKEGQKIMMLTSLEIFLKAQELS